MTRKTLLLAALIAAAPAFAQSAPPAPPAPPQMGHHAGQKGPHGMGMNARMFPSMSEAGRKTMHDAQKFFGQVVESEDEKDPEAEEGSDAEFDDVNKYLHSDDEDDTTREIYLDGKRITRLNYDRASTLYNTMSTQKAAAK
jgi:hypothetical protein